MIQKAVTRILSLNYYTRSTNCLITVYKREHNSRPTDTAANESKKLESKRLSEFRKKLRETSSIDDLGDQPLMHPSQKDDPLPPWPDNTNPNTGEVNGPRGPEPTRYGDWERKGRVSDF